MKLDLNKLIQNILLLMIVILLIVTTIILIDISKNGRYLPISERTIIDTRNGKSYRINSFSNTPILQEQK
jgi:hypothetical protein